VDYGVPCDGEGDDEINIPCRRLLAMRAVEALDTAPTSRSSTATGALAGVPCGRWWGGRAQRLIAEASIIARSARPFLGGDWRGGTRSTGLKNTRVPESAFECCGSTGRRHSPAHVSQKPLKGERGWTDLLGAGRGAVAKTDAREGFTCSRQTYHPLGEIDLIA
jgi:hypothetical protein